MITWKNHCQCQDNNKMYGFDMKKLFILLVSRYYNFQKGIFQ